MTSIITTARPPRPSFARSLLGAAGTVVLAASLGSAAVLAGFLLSHLMALPTALMLVPVLAALFGMWTGGMLARREREER